MKFSQFTQITPDLIFKFFSRFNRKANNETIVIVMEIVDWDQKQTKKEQLTGISFETSKYWLGVLSSSNTSRIFYKLSNKYVFKYVWRFKVLSIFRASAGHHYKTHTWVKVFKNGPSKIYGRELLKNLKGYVCLSRTYPFKFFKGCLP